MYQRGITLIELLWIMVLMMVTFVVITLTPVPVRAEGVTAPVLKDPSRLVVSLGNNWVLRPAINLSVMKVNLNNNDISFGGVIGTGYGLQYKNIVGLDLFADFEVARNDQPNYIGLSFVASIIQYISAGVMMTFADGEKPQYSLLFGGSLPLKIY